MRKGVELPRLHAAGDKVIARALGSGAGHEGSFDFEESLRRQVFADGQRDFVPQFDVELHGVAAQIDVAIFEAHLFVGQDRVGGKKWQRLGYIQNAQIFDNEFDFSGGNVGIDGVRVALFHGSDRCDDEFVAQGLGFLVNGGVQFVVEDDLRDAGAVAEVDKDNLAEVAAAVDPSHEHNFFASIGEPEGSAHMSSFEIA